MVGNVLKFPNALGLVAVTVCAHTQDRKPDHIIERYTK